MQSPSGLLVYLGPIMPVISVTKLFEFQGSAPHVFHVDFPGPASLNFSPSGFAISLQRLSPARLPAGEIFLSGNRRLRSRRRPATMPDPPSSSSLHRDGHAACQFSLFAFAHILYLLRPGHDIILDRRGFIEIRLPAVIFPHSGTPRLEMYEHHDGGTHKNSRASQSVRTARLPETAESDCSMRLV